MPSFNQYELMSSRDKHIVLFMCFSSAIVFFDFLIYLYIADAISAAFFPVSMNPNVGKLQGIGLFAVGYLARPLGGIVLGRYGDTKGRKPALLVSVLVTASSLLIMACLPTYAQWGIIAPALFILLRFIQGMAFGLYVPLAWIFVAEHVPKRSLAVGCSYVTASFFAGVFFSNIFFGWLNSSMTPEQLITGGWRLPFLIAAALSFLLLFAWRFRFIEETPIFIETTASKPNNHSNPQSFSAHNLNIHKDKSSPFSRLFRYCKHSVFVAMMLTLITASITIVVVLILPNLIELRFTLDKDLLSFSHSLGIVFMILGCVFYGLLSDYHDFGKILLVGSILLIGQMFAFYYHLQAGGDYILIMYALLGFFAGIIGMVPAILVQLFPTNVRLTGLAFSYNITYAIVGIAVPIGLGYATMQVSFSPALYIAFIGFIGMIMGLYFYNLPEFKKMDSVI